MSTEDACKLFVAGLPDSINEDVLRQLFEAAGATVVNVSLPKDRATGRARGFGFVTLGSAQEAMQARGTLDGSMQAGRAISVRPFSAESPRRGPERNESAGASPASRGPSAAASEDRTLYVGNLPYDASQQDVEQMLEGSGTGPIARVHLPQGPDGRMRGFGFVTMATADDAQAALSALQDVELRGRKLTVNIANRRGSGSGGGGGASATGPRPSPDRFPSPDRRPGPDRRPSPDRPARPPRREGSEATQDGPPPDFDASARPLEGRRARPTEKKKKKKVAARPARNEVHHRNRGGGNSWQNWDEVDDIDE